MTYINWIKLIQSEHDPRYYHRLFQFCTEILEDARNNPNSYMQDKLKLNPQQWSTIKKMLQSYKAYR